MDNEYNIHTNLNLIADRLNKTTMQLEKARQTNITKSQMREIIGKVLVSLQAESKCLINPTCHNSLNPIVVGDKDNGLYDELVRAVEDIGTVQYLLGKGDIKEADKLLANIKKRL